MEAFQKKETKFQSGCKVEQSVTIPREAKSDTQITKGGNDVFLNFFSRRSLFQNPFSLFQARRRRRGKSEKRRRGNVPPHTHTHTHTHTQIEPTLSSVKNRPALSSSVQLFLRRRRRRRNCYAQSAACLLRGGEICLNAPGSISPLSSLLSSPRR